MHRYSYPILIALALLLCSSIPLAQDAGDADPSKDEAKSDEEAQTYQLKHIWQEGKTYTHILLNHFEMHDDAEDERPTKQAFATFFALEYTINSVDADGQVLDYSLTIARAVKARDRVYMDQEFDLTLREWPVVGLEASVTRESDTDAWVAEFEKIPGEEPRVAEGAKKILAAMFALPSFGLPSDPVAVEGTWEPAGEHLQQSFFQSFMLSDEPDDLIKFTFAHEDYTGTGTLESAEAVFEVPPEEGEENIEQEETIYAVVSLTHEGKVTMSREEGDVFTFDLSGEESYSMNASENLCVGSDLSLSGDVTRNKDGEESKTGSVILNRSCYYFAGDAETVIEEYSLESYFEPTPKDDPAPKKGSDDKAEAGEKE